MTARSPVVNRHRARSIGAVFQALALSLGTLLCAGPAAAQSPAPGASARGKIIFEQHCAVCHGSDGRADTPVGRLLNPRPRNFADPVEMGRVTVDRIYRAIKEGRPGTAMSAWGRILSEMEIGDVIDYVRTFDTLARSAGLPPERLSLEIGRKIYNRECASCHGADGRAETEIAKVLNPRPRNFADPLGMARVDDGRMYLAIFRGRPGTAMGGRGELLAPSEIIDLMRYVRTLVQPLPPGMTPAKLDAAVGEQVYRQYCVACHGEEGNGQTTLGKHLVPPPRDFTRAQAMASISDSALAESVTRGIAGTAMAPWDGALSKEDIRRVIAFIRARFASR
jgi:cytochrome c oxidase cbb3-type subunit III